MNVQSCHFSTSVICYNIPSAIYNNNDMQCQWPLLITCLMILIPALHHENNYLYNHRIGLHC